MFLFGEQGWHAFIPLSRIDIEANPKLLAWRRNNLDVDRDDTSFTMTMTVMTAMLVISSHGVGEVAQHMSPRLSSTIIISNGKLNSHLCNMEDVCSRR